MKIVKTGDGSTTALSEMFGDLYHSINGAERESDYVYIKQGLNELFSDNAPIKILEVGMGTALNVLLTLQEFKQGLFWEYCTLEPFPIEPTLVSQFNFSSLKDDAIKKKFNFIHQCEWDVKHEIFPGFIFQKHRLKLLDFKPAQKFNLIYYDAFGPTYQAEMWDLTSSKKLFDLMENSGILVTYCAQGAFRRNLIQVGFEVERLAGPPGKREMIRATKVK